MVKKGLFTLSMFSFKDPRKKNLELNVGSYGLEGFPIVKMYVFLSCELPATMIHITDIFGPFKLSKPHTRTTMTMGRWC